MDDEVAAILDANVDGEETTPLWTDLAKWAFAQPDIPSPTVIPVSFASSPTVNAIVESS